MLLRNISLYQKCWRYKQKQLNLGSEQPRNIVLFGIHREVIVCVYMCVREKGGEGGGAFI